MEICKAPTLWLKALNKHMHIMYTEIENVIKKKKKEKRYQHGFLTKTSNTHTHTLYRPIGVKDNVA